MSEREYDTNGWFEVKGNPLSKVGVFPYSGRSLGLTDTPDQIFMVLRPAEELSTQACIDSFKLLPWIDNHSMLGAEGAGLMPAEQKGIQGVIGEEVYFDGDMLRGNIKVFSEAMSQLIANGKKELSCGYRCRYEKASGVYNSQPYAYIQRDIRGNHLALVENGRMGQEVAVLDHFVFTIDSKELMMANEYSPNDVDENPNDDDDLHAQDPQSTQSGYEDDNQDDLDDDDQDDDEDDGDQDDDDDQGDVPVSTAKRAVKVSGKVSGKANSKSSGKAKATSALDQSDLVARISQRVRKGILADMAGKKALYAQLSAHIGSFAHDEMDLQTMAAYGCKKLDLSAPRGHERTVLQAYLKGKGTSSAYAMDAMPIRKGGAIANYLNKQDLHKEGAKS